MTLFASRDLYSSDAVLVRLDASANPLDANALVAFALVPFGLSLLILLAWVRFVERRPLANIGLRHEHRLRSFLRGHAIGILGITAIVAVIVSSLFAIVHYSRGAHWLVSLGTFLFGVFTCAWALRSRSILGVMGWHSGWNWLLATGFGVPLTGLDLNIPPLLVGLRATGPDWLTGGSQGPEASVVCLGYFVLLAAWLIFWPRRTAAA